MDFPRFSKVALLFEMQICTEVPESFEILRFFPRFALWPLKEIWDFAIGPLGTGRRFSGRIPASRRSGPTGPGGGSVLRVPLAPFPGSAGSSPQPAGRLSGDAVGRPLELALRRTRRQGRCASGTWSCRGRSWWWWCAHTAGRGSEQEAYRGGGHGARWQSTPRAGKGVTFYRRACVLL
jgi:hypothetical protein